VQRRGQGRAAVGEHRDVGDDATAAQHEHRDIAGEPAQRQQPPRAAVAAAAKQRGGEAGNRRRVQRGVHKPDPLLVLVTVGPIRPTRRDRRHGASQPDRDQAGRLATPTADRVDQRGGHERAERELRQGGV
jgi:hypothetical protein